METFRQYELQLSIADDLDYFIGYIPHYALSKCFLNMEKVSGEYTLCMQKNPNTGDQECQKGQIFTWGEHGILDILVQMATTGTVCFVLLFIMESRIVRDVVYCVRKYLKLKLPEGNADDGDIDKNVQAETDRVAQMSADDLNMHGLVLKDLTKLYGKLAAINQLSVGIEGFVIFMSI